MLVFLCVALSLLAVGIFSCFVMSIVVLLCLVDPVITSLGKRELLILLFFGL